jgi:hypothetical protein
VQTTPYEIFDKIRLYIKDVNKVTDCIKRLEELKEDLKKIEAMEDSELSENLRRFSFFGLTEEEIDYFINILDELNTLAKKIFEGSDSGRINFTEHFKRLLQQLQEKLEKYEDNDVLRQVKSFLESLLERLEGATDMEGGIEDLKEAIFYYLNVLEQKNNSNWIVRGFEQLDGGIILSEGRTGAEKYHLCLLSDQMLEKRAKDMFSWPLSDSFFTNYRGRKDHLEAVLTSIREYENFIIYSIFYSACYCKKKLIISYCQEDSELNKHSPLFIFRIMGLEEDEAGEIQLANEILKPKQNDFKYKSLTYEFPGEVENYEAFLICPFRFFLNHVFDKDKICYTDEFQCNYYLTLVVRDAFWRSYSNGDRKEEIEKKLEELYNKIKPLLKFWNNFTLADIYNKTLHDVEEFCFECISTQNKKQLKIYDKRYMTRKLKLLMWKIDGCNVHLDPVDKLHDKIEKYFSTNDYSFEKKSTELCVYCNQNDYCILRYLDGE